jgi:hypothetical protein
MRIGAIELMAGLTGRLSGWLDQNRGRWTSSLLDKNKSKMQLNLRPAWPE